MRKSQGTNNIFYQAKHCIYKIQTIFIYKIYKVQKTIKKNCKDKNVFR